MKHGYGPNKKLSVGDILPTGHKVKDAYPKSIREQLESSEEFVQMQHDHRKDNRKKKKDKNNPKIEQYIRKKTITD